MMLDIHQIIRSARYMARLDAYTLAYRDKARAAAVAWRAAHPLRSRAHRVLASSRKRAAKFGVVDTLTIGEVVALLEADRPECSWCKADLSGGDFHVDHRVPLSKGGENTAANLALACSGCNLTKQAMMPDKFNPTGPSVWVDPGPRHFELGVLLDLLPLYWLTDEAELARRMGMNEATVSRVLHGEQMPGLDFLAGLMRAIPGISLDYLFRDGEA